MVDLVVKSRCHHKRGLACFFARGSSNAMVIVDHSIASSFEGIGDGFLMRMEEPGRGRSVTVLDWLQKSGDKELRHLCVRSKDPSVRLINQVLTQYPITQQKDMRLGRLLILL